MNGKGHENGHEGISQSATDKRGKKAGLRMITRACAAAVSALSFLSRTKV